jgi:hypothetical protein
MTDIVKKAVLILAAGITLGISYGIVTDNIVVGQRAIDQQKARLETEWKTYEAHASAIYARDVVDEQKRLCRIRYATLDVTRDGTPDAIGIRDCGTSPAWVIRPLIVEIPYEDHSDYSRKDMCRRCDGLNKYIYRAGGGKPVVEDFNSVLEDMRNGKLRRVR